jgi:uncharacterized protein (DUF924 family)
MRSHDVLNYWFGQLPRKALSESAQWELVKRLPLWAGKWGRLLWDVDADVRSRFSADLARAARGEYDDWVSDPTGRLALVLLLDQFSRNIHRGTPDAFAYDTQTLPIALEGIARREDKSFYPVARSFFYLPLVHQEDVAHQERAVALYSEALRESRGLQWIILRAEYWSALRHRQIIRRFGRFPHRNRILARTSTREELRFLRQPFSHF